MCVNGDYGVLQHTNSVGMHLAGSIRLKTSTFNKNFSLLGGNFRVVGTTCLRTQPSNKIHLWVPDRECSWDGFIGNPSSDSHPVYDKQSFK